MWQARGGDVTGAEEERRRQRGRWGRIAGSRSGWKVLGGEKE